MTTHKSLADISTFIVQYISSKPEFITYLLTLLKASLKYTVTIPETNQEHKIWCILRDKCTGLLEIFLAHHSELDLKKEDYLIIKNILDNIVPSNQQYIKYVIIGLFGEAHETNIFKGFDNIQFDFPNNRLQLFENIITSSFEFHKQLIGVFLNFDLVCNTLKNCWTSESYQDTIKRMVTSDQLKLTCIDDKMFENCLKINKDDIIIAQFVRYKLDNPLNMINHIISLSIINEQFYIFSSILNGKRKCDVRNFQDSINFHQNILLPYYDLLFDPEIERLLEIMEQDTEQLNNIVTCRIQYLRIQLYYTDGDHEMVEKNNFLLSNEDLKIFLAILDEYTDIDVTELLQKNDVQLSDICHTLKNKVSLNMIKYDVPTKVLIQNAYEKIPLRKKGLMTRILSKLYKGDSSNRHLFLICNIIETSLRGYNMFLQLFLIFSGLVNYLVKTLINSNEDSPSTTIQISFDLLGELIKYNIINIKLLEQILEEEKYVEPFIQKVFSNFIDSNVFLRHLVLSKENQFNDKCCVSALMNKI